jgi:hypothetical protein
VSPNNGLSLTVIRGLAADGEEVSAASVVWLCDEVERMKRLGDGCDVFTWPSFADWNFQCGVRLPMHPDDRDFEYAIQCLEIGRKAMRDHVAKRTAVPHVG